LVCGGYPLTLPAIIHTLNGLVSEAAHNHFVKFSQNAGNDNFYTELGGLQESAPLLFACHHLEQQ
jgi:hypothetical protein